MYYYDVNSLYPYAALADMPGVNCRQYYYIDSEHMSIHDLFGFFHCMIDASQVKVEYLGLLLTRTKGLIFPHGKWEGWYFSEEVKFASKDLRSPIKMSKFFLLGIYSSPYVQLR